MSMTMRLLFLLSAFMTAIAGAVSGRVAVPQPLVTSSAAIESQAAAPATIAVIVLAAALGALASITLPLPRPFRRARRARIYLERLRV